MAMRTEDAVFRAAHRRARHSKNAGSRAWPDCALHQPPPSSSWQLFVNLPASFCYLTIFFNTTGIRLHDTRNV